MTNSMTDKQDPPIQLSADDVVTWLRDNPDFLNRHPEACDLLHPPRAHTDKGVVDFQQFMVRRLREDRDGIIEEAREIVETSRSNMSNQARTHRAVLMLLEARSFEDFIHTITMDCASLLDVDIISLVVEADGDTIPHISMNGVRVLGTGAIDLLTQGQQIALEAATNGLDELYGGGAGLVKSQALVRLNIAAGAPTALLAFGSRDPALFAPGQGTELLSFLAQVVERGFRLWLDLPPQ